MPDIVDLSMSVVELRSQEEFLRWTNLNSEVLSFRRALQKRYEDELQNGATGIYHGYCTICCRHSHFIYDRMFSRSSAINWRERLVCVGCNLNNRLRLSLMAADSLGTLSSGDVYLTEQMTPIADILGERCQSLVRSEFDVNKPKSGTISANGLRHEDLTDLSFKEDSFDLVLSFDVLEHIPNYNKALMEIRRVLRENGSLILTAPFDLNSSSHIVRAKVDRDGTVIHILEPEYHGDPMSPSDGILCFYHFGWDLLTDLRSCGFHDSSVRLYWSSDFANIGQEQIVIHAKS